MADKRTKTISYRRALWLTVAGKEQTLEKFMLEALKKLSTVEQRQFRRGDGQIIQCIGHLVADSGCFLHVASETPGDHASTLPTEGLNKDGIDVDTSPPPDKREYMDGDIFAYVKGNSVCICSTGLRDASLKLYCQELFEAAKLPKDANKFDLVSVADADKLKLIEAQGVKSIDVKATLFEASVNYAKRKGAIPQALESVGKHITAIFGNDPKEATPDNIGVTIELATDDRMKSGKVVGAKRMAEIAKEVMEGEEEFTIITRQNQRISSSEIYLRRKVQIERHGKSIKRNKAWAALEQFYKDLINSGAVNQ